MESAKEPGKTDDLHTLEYIADLCQQLEKLARAEGFDTLGYFLDMARLEAEDHARRLTSSKGAGC